MDTTVVGKEVIYHGDELHKSRFSLLVLNVIFEERLEDGILGWHVFAITSRGREQIGLITQRINAIGSRDLVVTDKGGERLFLYIPAGESVSKDKEDFVSHWKGSHIFVRPELPRESDPGDQAFIGGDHVLIEAWVQQARVWMALALETSEKGDSHHLNIAYIMAGYAIELLFKSLAWIEEMNIIPVHKIGSFFSGFSENTRRVVESIVRDNGWQSAAEFVNYVDDYLSPVHRRYFGISTDKTFRGLNTQKDQRLTLLANVHQGLCDEVSKLLARAA